MGLSAAQELIIREALATNARTIPETGEVQPSPLYLANVAEFWGTHDPAKLTQVELETSIVAGLWIYPLRFDDDFSSGGVDSPNIGLKYEYYLFRQYGRVRVNDNGEEVMPELFESQVLLQHNLFIKAWLDLKSQLQGNRALGLDTAIFATAKTTSALQAEDIDNMAECKFIPGIAGFSVRLHETVNLKLRAC